MSIYPLSLSTTTLILISALLLSLYVYSYKLSSTWNPVFNAYNNSNKNNSNLASRVGPISVVCMDKIVGDSSDKSK